MTSIRGYTEADLARLRSVQVRPAGWTWRTKDQVREYRDEQGRPVKVVRDQLGNFVRLRWDGQDVKIVAPLIRVRTAIQEVR